MFRCFVRVLPIPAHSTADSGRLRSVDAVLPRVPAVHPAPSALDRVPAAVGDQGGGGRRRDGGFPRQRPRRVDRRRRLLWVPALLPASQEGGHRHAGRIDARHVFGKYHTFTHLTDSKTNGLTRSLFPWRTC